MRIKINMGHVAGIYAFSCLQVHVRGFKRSVHQCSSFSACMLIHTGNFKQSVDVDVDVDVHVEQEEVCK